MSDTHSDVVPHNEDARSSHDENEEASSDEDEDSSESEDPFRFQDLPAELRFDVIQQIDDLRDVICLSLTCKEYRNLYLADPTRATAAVRTRFVAAIDEFYTFLTTLHIPESDHVRPPPGGWPNITPENCKDWGKSDFAIDVIRHLPYIRRSVHANNNHDYYNTPDYKCELIDYSLWGPGKAYPGEEISFGPFDQDAPRGNDDNGPPYKHRIILADGHESGGVALCLDTFSGQIFEEIIRMEDGDVEPIEDFLSGRITRMRNLRQVFVPGDVPLFEPSARYREEEYDAQVVESRGEPSAPGEFFGTPHDYLWVRYLYEKHGWPGPTWEKEQCLSAVRAYFEARYDEG